MADDIFTAVAETSAALVQTSQDLTRVAMSISQKTAEFRSGLREEERTKELLARIEKRHKDLQDVHQMLSSYLEKL